MKKALILGHFLPLHNMHQGLIDVVQNLGYEIILGVFAHEDDIISFEVRKSWMQKYGAVLPLTFKNSPYETTDLKALPHIDLVAGSNPDLLHVSKALGCAHFLWDPAREANPLASQDILDDLVGHWMDMPSFVRTSIQRRLTFVGPESVGKSWFAKSMAKRFGEPHVPEYGRPHEKYRAAQDYTGDELLELATRHRASRIALSAMAGPILFEDTDELMTAVWSEMLLGRETPKLEEMINSKTTYILYHWDTPWEEDKLRYFARSDLRKSFYEKIKAKLDKHHCTYVQIGGDWDAREAATLEIVKSEMSKVTF